MKVLLHAFLCLEDIREFFSHHIFPAPELVLYTSCNTGQSFSLCKQQYEGFMTAAPSCQWGESKTQYVLKSRINQSWWKANLKKFHTPIKTTKHLWGFLFMFSPDGGEQKWEERKLQSIISTDFIDLIISDSWGSWMLFWCDLEQINFLLSENPGFFFQFFFLNKEELWTRKPVIWKVYEACIQIPVLLHIYIGHLITSYSASQNWFSHLRPCPWGIPLYLSISIM